MPEVVENGQVQTAATEVSTSTGTENAATTEVAQTAEQIDINNQMRYAFDEPIVKREEKVGTENIQTGAENTSTAVANSTTENNQASQVPDYTAFVKENFGLASVEEVKAQWEELQALKANPPKGEILTPEKIKEAYSILDKQDRWTKLLDGDVSKDNAAAIVKEGMKQKYTGLTAPQIEYKFNKQFGIPTKPVEDSFTDTDEYTTALSEWNNKVEEVQMELEIEANVVRPDLAKALTELKLPDIQPQQTVVDENYEAWKASNADVSDNINTIIKPALTSLTANDVQLGFKVSDANNQMEFDVALTPTQEDFEKAKQDSLLFDNFFGNVCYDKDGNFQPKNVQKLVLLYNNWDNYAQSIARQAVNEERKRVVAKETAGNGNGNRDYNVNTEKTELQKSMEFALS